MASIWVKHLFLCQNLLQSAGSSKLVKTALLKVGLLITRGFVHSFYILPIRVEVKCVSSQYLWPIFYSETHCGYRPWAICINMEKVLHQSPSHPSLSSSTFLPILSPVSPPSLLSLPLPRVHRFVSTVQFEWRYVKVMCVCVCVFHHNYVCLSSCSFRSKDHSYLATWRWDEKE